MGAHAGGAVADAFFDGGRRALDHVLDRHRMLDRRHALHGEMRAALGRVLAAAEDTGLVEMDMGIHETRADQPAMALHLFPGAAAQFGGYGGDAAALYADVGGRLIRPGIGEPHITQDQIEIHWESCTRDGTHVAPCAKAHVAPCAKAYVAPCAGALVEEMAP